MGESEVFVFNAYGGLESHPVLDNYKVGLRVMPWWHLVLSEIFPKKTLMGQKTTLYGKKCTAEFSTEKRF